MNDETLNMDDWCFAFGDPEVITPVLTWAYHRGEQKPPEFVITNVSRGMRTDWHGPRLCDGRVYRLEVFDPNGKSVRMALFDRRQQLPTVVDFGRDAFGRLEIEREAAEDVGTLNLAVGEIRRPNGRLESKLYGRLLSIAERKRKKRIKQHKSLPLIPFAA